ncbi:hypothetical protein HMPREF0201_02605 [Cedecea davisae DSM 4568]|uniref:Uncharacterized protein n=1 Tax=Cedecea davisae DSM 4568 TaxID=566551 RepID=S3ITF2_9ENTR|nr:hypothetical protein HMPREF0201_02605 [Cedecea davisae DSM 4568]
MGQYVIKLSLFWCSIISRLRMFYSFVQKKHSGEIGPRFAVTCVRSFCA